MRGGIVGLGTAAAVLLGCAGPQPVRRDKLESPPPSNLPGLRQSITAQVGEARCSSDAVCRTIALGAKPCGGPWQYLVYSTSATDSARLAGEVVRYNEEEQRLNRAEGRISDCSLVAQPRVSCASGRCRAVGTEVR